MRKLIIVLILFPGLLYPQTVPLNEVDFYLELINTIDNYEKYSSLRKKSFYDKYDNLFLESAKVFDDIVPSSTFGKYLSFNEYSMNIRKLKRKRLSTNIEILEIGEKKEKSDGNSGEIDVYVTIDRDMAFESKEGNISYNDIIEYIDWPQRTHCIISLQYNIFTDKNGDAVQEGIDWKIKSIKSIKPLNRLNIYIPFTKNILGKPQILNASENGVTLDGNAIKFVGEKLNYFIKKNINRENNLTIIGKETEYQFSNVKPLNKSTFVQQVIFREKAPLYIYYNHDLTNSYSLLNTNSNSVLGTHSFSDSRSISAAIYLYKNKSLITKEFLGGKIIPKFGVNLLYSKSNLKISNSEFTSVNENAIDADGHNYIRTNHIYNINEEVSFNSALIFATARLDIVQLIKKNEIQIGLLGNLLVLPVQNSVTTNISATGNYSGEYEQFDLVIGDDEQFERYDLGTYSLTNSKELQVEYAPFSVIEFGLVVDWFAKNGIGVSVGVSSIISNKPVSTSITTELSTGSDNLNSMLEVIDEFNIENKIKLKLGLIYKL